MKRFVPFLMMAGLLVSAGCNKAKMRIDASQTEPVASVMNLRYDTTVHYLTDYFPTYEKADSITGNAFVSVVAYDSVENTFRCVRHANGLGTLRVWKGGEAREVVVYSEKVANERPLLYTLGCENDVVKLGCSQQPQQVVALWNNIVLDSALVTMGEGEISVELPQLDGVAKRSYLRVYAFGGDMLFSDILVPLEYGKPLLDVAQVSRHDKQSQVLYSLMIDRFNNGNTANDWKMNSPEVLDIVDYQGGDIKGITQKIEEGFFDSLGITTIWISPITQNPYDAWGQYDDPKTKFSGYHGYWPIYVTALERRFSTPEELREMLRVAHEHNMNVILDYVANHMHINSPTLQAHPDWVTDSITPDGRRNFELWDEFRLTTWFDRHIPSLDLERKEVYEPMTDSAMYWLENYDFDGFRHDACKHIPEVYWRTLTRKIRTEFPDRDLYQIGETYGNTELIGSYLKTGMLDAQFDFNIYHTAIDVLGREGRSMNELDKVIKESLAAYGAHHVMGNISGNHDKARFISLAGGALSFDEDHKYAGWHRTITVGDTAVAYKKLALLEAINLTIPGVPCIYQGDEYGEPGGNDPDNRRMMRFGGYNAQEEDHLAKVKTMTHLRRNSLPLQFGDYLPLYSDDDVLAFARVYMGDVVVVAFNKGMAERELTLELPATLDASQLKAHFGNSLQVNGNQLTVKLQALSFDIFE